MGLLKNPIYVTLNEVKGLLTLVESSSRRFFAALRMTRGGFFNSPAMCCIAYAEVTCGPGCGWFSARSRAWG